MNKEFFSENRNKYFDKIQNNSLSVFFSGRVYPRSADEDFDFEVDKNFWYLTGIDQANVILALVKSENRQQAVLFIEENDPVLSKWVGRKLEIEEARAISGIEDVRYRDEFDNFVYLLFNNTRHNLDHLSCLYLSLERRNEENYSSLALNYSRKFHKLYPEVTIINSYGLVIGLRMIKNEAEIALIKASIATTKTGIETLMAHAKAGIYEYQLESYFDQHLKYNGQKTTAFKTIVATGKNATILHYVRNNTLLQNDELILFDLGCKTSFYVSDISRTFPVNGRFTPRQREIYQEVLEVNKKCIAFLKPGRTWKEFNEYAKEELAAAAIRLGLMKEKSELSQYYWHSIGHFIGLDTHDPGIYEENLRPGMVLTVEPGLYIEAEAIGVRIEDNVLITEDGVINLSADIIKEIPDIETFMAK